MCFSPVKICGHRDDIKIFMACNYIVVIMAVKILRKDVEMI